MKAESVNFSYSLNFFLIEMGLLPLLCVSISFKVESVNDLSDSCVFILCKYRLSTSSIM